MGPERLAGNRTFLLFYFALTGEERESLNFHKKEIHGEAASCGRNKPTSCLSKFWLSSMRLKAVRLLSRAKLAAQAIYLAKWSWATRQRQPCLEAQVLSLTIIIRVWQ